MTKTEAAWVLLAEAEVREKRARESGDPEASETIQTLCGAARILTGAELFDEQMAESR
jgi:hypothetical protein